MTAECYLELKLLSVAFIGLFLSLLLGFLTSTSAFPEDDSTKIPFFNPRPTNVSYNTGETAVLSCSVMNVDARYVVWRRTSEPNPISFGEYIYSPDPRFNVSRNPRRHEWNLRIRDVQLTDGGVYECAISSRKKYIRHVLLRVYERPTTAKPTVSMTGSKFVTKGETISLQCNATGSYHAPDDIDWFKDGNKLIPSVTNNIKVNTELKYEDRTLTSMLVVKHSKLEDAGIYVCRSTDLEIASNHVHVLDEGESRHNVKRVSGTSNGGKNHCCITFSSHFARILAVSLTFNYLIQQLAKT
ncbi:lachesin-like isoform X1 [Mizuhopecten yessoensis]|uniref:lachesin-like isoform X1 n=1 Tax=Mizuhopecten yessoensis TaxID=6573 RepID=UPI000B45E2A3|nr:lachesin-like isoform X1 [Mizuhopecten yessoensis]